MFNPVDFIYKYVYKRKEELIPFEKLTAADIQALQLYQPRTQAEMFPEDYLDDELEVANSFYLYRGLYFHTKESYESFMAQINQGVLITNSITSWTHSFDVAKNFAEGAGYYSYNPQPLIDRKGYKGIVLAADFIKKEQTLFSVQEAAFDIEEEFEEELEQREPSAIFHEKEDEIILLPGCYSVEVLEGINLRMGD